MNEFNKNDVRTPDMLQAVPGKFESHHCKEIGMNNINNI